MAAIHGTNWKEDAIERAEGITDAWEITKVYAGRLAEWVLFVCMIANIIEILPGVEVAGWLANTILGIQAVTLDIAGFGLATMAEQARINRETDAARRAKSTAYLLIGLMMITVLSLSVGTLWHEAKTYTDGADKLLILIRVVMTVVYGHVLHGLRQHSMKVIPMPVIEERLTMLSQRVAELRMPEPVNYVTLAAHIVPLLPQPKTPDYERLVEQIVLQVVAQMKDVYEKEKAFHVASEKPPAKPRTFHLKSVKSQVDSLADDRQAFIREYLTDHPEASISMIMKAAQVKGITLSTGYVSQQRKLFQQEAS